MPRSDLDVLQCSRSADIMWHGINSNNSSIFKLSFKIWAYNNKAEGFVVDPFFANEECFFFSVFAFEKPNLGEKFLGSVKPSHSFWAWKPFDWRIWSYLLVLCVFQWTHAQCNSPMRLFRCHERLVRGWLPLVLTKSFICGLILSSFDLLALMMTLCRLYSVSLADKPNPRM